MWKQNLELLKVEMLTRYRITEIKACKVSDGMLIRIHRREFAG